MVDFFVSYAPADRGWATWIAWQLEELGYTTAVQEWDFLPGSHFVFEMQKHAASAARTVALLSPDYLERAFTHAEWAAAFRQDPQGKERRLLPIRVRDCKPEGLLNDLVWLDLVSLNEPEAKAALIRTVDMLGEDHRSSARGKPVFAPVFPQLPGDPAVERRSMHRRFGFVHAAVRAGGMLDLTDVTLPYFGGDLATEPRPVRATVFACLWFPRTEYLRNSALSRFTPCVAVCTTDFATVSDAFRTAVAGHETTLLTANPSSLRLREKEIAVRGAATALHSCFVASVAAPEIMLRVGRAKPSVAYQSMCDLLLLPIAELHRKRAVARMDIRLPHLGEGTADVIRASKRILLSVFSRKSQSAVQITDGTGLSESVAAVCRIVAWAVGAYYNHTDRRWLSELEAAAEIEI